MRKVGLLFAAACMALAAASSGHAEDPIDIAGIYELQGETTVEGSPDRFLITGKLVVRQKGNDCSTVVEAAIRWAAGNSGPVSAALIGNGDMKLAGRQFTGNAQLQSLVSEVPELDVAVPYAPRTAGPVVDAVAKRVARSPQELKKK